MRAFDRMGAGDGYSGTEYAGPAGGKGLMGAIGNHVVGDRGQTPSSPPKGNFALLDMELTGLISPRMRHIIKRYVKKVGLRNIKVEHLCDGGPATVRLVVSGDAFNGLNEEQVSKLTFLEGAIRKTLSRPINGFVPHPSRADPEALRLELCRIEPSMKRVFYTRA